MAERSHGGDSPLRARLLALPRLPALDVRSELGLWVNLRKLATRPLVLFFFPGREVTPPRGLDGTTYPDSERLLRWSGSHRDLRDLGYDLIGVSSQLPSDQRRLAALELLPFGLLSDSGLELADRLGLPTSARAVEPRYEPLTLIAHGERIQEVLFPIDEARETGTVLGWIRARSPA